MKPRLLKLYKKDKKISLLMKSLISKMTRIDHLQCSAQVVQTEEKLGTS